MEQISRARTFLANSCKCKGPLVGVVFVREEARGQHGRGKRVGNEWKCWVTRVLVGFLERVDFPRCEMESRGRHHDPTHI